MNPLGTSRDRAVQRWCAGQALIWLPALAWLAAVRPTGAWLAAVGVALVASFAALWVALGTGSRLADRVTLARFAALIAVAAAIVAGGGVTWISWSLVVVAVGADLLDGWCARRWGGSDAGATLDAEADQLTMIAITALAIGVGVAPAWIVLVPAFRYATTALRLAARASVHDPKPRDGDNRVARAICAVVMTLLLLVLAPIDAPELTSIASAIAVVALAYSHGRDALFTLRSPAASG